MKKTCYKILEVFGKRPLSGKQYREEFNDLLPIHFFSLSLTLTTTHAFLATYRSCPTFQAGPLQAIMLSLQDSARSLFFPFAWF